MPKIQHLCRVVANEKICPRFFRLSLDARPILKLIRPGQFIHIKVSDGLVPFFRRPFSVYRAKKYIEILYEPIGPGTRALSFKKKGDELDTLGPLGNTFSLPPSGTKQVVMIGGGIGIAPFLIFSDLLAKKKYELIVLYGGRSGGHVYKMEDFKKNGCKVFISTDDGSIGVKGRVTKLFSNINIDPKKTVLYTCGPHAMMHAVQEFAVKNHLRCEASCEEIMACALGACLGCSIPTTEGYKTTCYDGPVFDIKKVIF